MKGQGPNLEIRYSPKKTIEHIGGTPTCATVVGSGFSSVNSLLWKTKVFQLLRTSLCFGEHTFNRRFHLQKDPPSNQDAMPDVVCNDYTHPMFVIITLMICLSSLIRQHLGFPAGFLFRHCTDTDLLGFNMGVYLVPSDHALGL